MNYELAKQLKDAGFPQEGMKEGIGRYFGELNHDGTCDNPTFKPTLPELMKACGTYISLADNTNGEWVSMKYSFDEQAKKFETIDFGVGSTPEESMSRLWLKLNGKA